MDVWSLRKATTIIDLGMYVNRYRILTVGLFTAINAGFKYNGQLYNPDIVVAIGSGAHKQSQPDSEFVYFEGAPNFIIDVYNDFKSAEIKQRKLAYEEAGVQEYVIVSEDCEKVEWNRLIAGKFKKVKPDRDGMIRSAALPGLWIPTNKLRRDPFAVLASIEHGITRREHHDLMDGIWNKN